MLVKINHHLYSKQLPKLLYRLNSDISLNPNVFIRPSTHMQLKIGKTSIQESAKMTK